MWGKTAQSSDTMLTEKAQFLLQQVALNTLTIHAALNLCISIIRPMQLDVLYSRIGVITV